MEKDIASGLWILERRKPVPDPCAGVLSINADGCGNLSAVVTGGGPGPFTFSWTGPGGFTSSAPSISPLVAGTYNVTRPTCRGSVSIEFTPPQPLHFCACIDNTEKFTRHLILSDFSGGSGSYTYSLNGGPDLPVVLSGGEMSVDILAAPMGNQLDVKVKDANCVGVASMTVTLYVPAAEFAFNNALHFDGVNDWVNFQPLNGAAIPAEGTVALWFYPGQTPDIDSPPAYEGVKDTNFVGGTLWAGRNSDNFRLQRNENFIQAVIGGTVANSPNIQPTYLDADYKGDWMFAAMRWIRTAPGVYTVSVFFGGKNQLAMTQDFLPGATVSTAFVPTVFEEFAIGAIGEWAPGRSNTRNHYGLIDEPRYFSRALEDCEIECLFNEGNGNNQLDLDPALQVYLPLNQSSGTTAPNAGVMGGNALLRGFSGPDLAPDTQWRTAAIPFDAWRSHAPFIAGTKYEALSFLRSKNFVDSTYDVAPGSDNFSCFFELEFHDPQRTLGVLPAALCGVFRNTNSFMYGNPGGELRHCATPIKAHDVPIFDVRINPATDQILVQIADRNDVNGTTLVGSIPNWKNHKVGLAFVIDGGGKFFAYYNDGSGSGTAQIIGATFDDSVWRYDGRFIFGSPCPWDFDFASGCAALGLTCHSFKLYDAHIYRATTSIADFNNWYNEVLALGAGNLRAPRTPVSAADPRVFRCLRTSGALTNERLTELAQGKHGTLRQGITAANTLSGPVGSPCAAPALYSAAIVPLASYPIHWSGGVNDENGGAWDCN